MTDDVSLAAHQHVVECAQQNAAALSSRRRHGGHDGEERSPHTSMEPTNQTDEFYSSASECEEGDIDKASAAFVRNDPIAAKRRNGKAVRQNYAHLAGKRSRATKTATAGKAATGRMANAQPKPKRTKNNKKGGGGRRKK